jgi:hypothetical protein
MIFQIADCSLERAEGFLIFSCLRVLHGGSQKFESFFKRKIFQFFYIKNLGLDPDPDTRNSPDPD